MTGARSRANWIGTYIPEVLSRLAAFFFCLGLVLAPGMRAEAAENAAAEQPADLVMIRVEAEPEETDPDALLERINAIRMEACEEGVNNPVNGEPLTPADYVPMQWSYDLEKIALLRAAESMILQDHMRPDGTECFTAAPEGVSYTMETLAWGFDDAADAVEGWYSEKVSYVETDGRPAGHYMALINPENRFAGIASLSSQWQRNACAGAFGSYGTVSETGAGSPEEVTESGRVWMIPLRRDLLPTAVKRAVEVAAGRIYRAARF